MWKKHKHLFLFPVAVLGILAVCWTSGQVSEFNKWYLIIAGTVGLYCWVSGACGAPAGAEEGEGRAVRAEEPIL